MLKKYPTLSLLTILVISIPAFISLVDRDDSPVIPVVISTWNHGQIANDTAFKILNNGGSALDAVEKGVNATELDPQVDSVGYGGIPDQEGRVTLDAMIMDGKTHRAGSVGCLFRIKKAISVARKVMEKTTHTMLVGEDAVRFAKQMGFKEEELLTEKARQRWEMWKVEENRGDFWRDAHDTIGAVAIDKDGNIAVGCSTSGLGFKIPGRVGDSPIIGAGAYCDNEVGGAAATGNGDIMMRYCLSYQVVEFMRMGLSPQAACEEAIRRMHKKGDYPFVGLVALNKKGEYGAAFSGTDRFTYVVTNEKMNKKFTETESTVK